MCSLLLEPRSLLVLQDDMYTRYIPYQELISTAWRAEGASNYAERHLDLKDCDTSLILTYSQVGRKCCFHSRRATVHATTKCCYCSDSNAAPRYSVELDAPSTLWVAQKLLTIIMNGIIKLWHLIIII